MHEFFVRNADEIVSLMRERINGKREREKEHNEGTLHTYERSYGQFSRSFALPDTVDFDKVDAT